jgi:CheY-like chemotaxis protein
MKNILIVDDDVMMTECLARFLAPNKITSFTNAIDAIQNLVDPLPDLIFLDILLDGPDGFTFLNELSSYEDTAQIPVVIITSLNLKQSSLDAYNVKKVLKKEEITPEMIKDTVEEITKNDDSNQSPEENSNG